MAISIGRPVRRMARRGCVLASIATFTTTIGVVALAAPAQATPASGVSATLVYQTTVGDTTYTLRKITIQPGGGTGWHYHDGPLYALVESGVLTHSASDCVTTRVYQAHDLIQEAVGPNGVHEGRNLGNKPVVLEALYILPAGRPFSVDAPDPGCGY
jgi:quercetin dioxygenase-like cupin family protein